MWWAKSVSHRPLCTWKAGRWIICCVHFCRGQWGIASWLFWNPTGTGNRVNIQWLGPHTLISEWLCSGWVPNISKDLTQTRISDFRGLISNLRISADEEVNKPWWASLKTQIIKCHIRLGEKCTKFEGRGDCTGVSAISATYYLCDPEQIHYVFCTSVFSSENSENSISTCSFHVLNHQINFGITACY